ncbi:4-alpha-glucanotransferase [Steroidobacter sp. S1-65]|uniref:4-alpha-glucanotransferase n=1 Tax=Steroidobacter gossypii TaxID=2805490 RepID=A0ABS1WSL5_9GAMM|nr:4-alpha-glucanotransferase [Steroidobacter gossypii]MBM0103965.1 4-alpha-glucanotransferase [Steroidobacter gossypii]
MDNPIRQLAQLHGIADSYLDFRGRPKEVSVASQTAILSALGIEAADDAAAEDAIHQYQTRRWTGFVPPAVVAAEGQPIAVSIAVPVDLAAKRVDWNVQLESGEPRSGTAQLSKLQKLEEAQIDNRSYRRLAVSLPALPMGYHTASFALDTGLQGTVRVVVTPEQCFEAPAIAQGKRLWGIAVQLYSLRADDNWGIGDFRDLRQLVGLAGPLGCGIIGLNPLHALMPANPAHISPYSPSNRQFLNVLYIAVEEVPDFAECELARKRVAEPQFQALLKELRATRNVDYVRVAAAKFEILSLLYASFRERHLARNTPRAAAFRQFQEIQGDALRLHATYDALDGHFRLQGPQYWGWPSWPEEYRDPTSSTVQRFTRERVEDVEYFEYLQWLAAEQLANAQSAAREAGMAVGLYGDVAVGANPAGSETWSNRHLYLQGASVGAPPDALALKGQDWGIPPQDPNELRTQQYQPFVGLVRNMMRYVAALRFDHVMTLYRLWWVPRGMLSKDGTYVHYPLADLMAILALESQRNHCIVIGEDLGTVPEAMTEAMEHYRLYHYKVLIFEQHPDGSFKRPDEYVQHSMAVVTTHDLPTLRGWWDGSDVTLRAQLDLYPTDELRQQAHDARIRDRVNLLRALVAAGLWHWNEGDPLPPYSAALSRAVHAFIGLSSANIALLQIEDLIGMTDPVNVPGTDTEHANWQRKVSASLADIFSSHEAKDILSAMDTARQGINPNA